MAATLFQLRLNGGDGFSRALFFGGSRAAQADGAQRFVSHC